MLRQFSGAQARSLQRERQEGNAGGRRFTRSCWRDAQGRRVAEHWLVHGVGHAWVGGKAAGSHTDASGPNASSEMLAFFLEHGR